MNPLSVHPNTLPSLAVLVSETEKPVPLSPMWFCVFISFHPVHWVFCSFLCANVGLVGNILYFTFYISLFLFSAVKQSAPHHWVCFLAEMAWYVGVLGGLEWYHQTSGIRAISADLPTPLATRCDRYDSTPKRQGRSHDNHPSVRHTPLSLLVSRSGSWVVVRWTPAGLQGSMILVWPSILCLALWRFCLILAIWN